MPLSTADTSPPFTLDRAHDFASDRCYCDFSGDAEHILDLAPRNPYRFLAHLPTAKIRTLEQMCRTLAYCFLGIRDPNRVISEQDTSKPSELAGIVTTFLEHGREETFEYDEEQIIRERSKAEANGDAYASFALQKLIFDVTGGGEVAETASEMVRLAFFAKRANMGRVDMSADIAAGNEAGLDGTIDEAVEWAVSSGNIGVGR